MSERPCQPFYKPYGMTDEECEYKQRIAAEKLEQWKQEQNESNLVEARVMPNEVLAGGNEELIERVAKYLIAIMFTGANLGIGNSSLRNLTEEEYFNLNKDEWKIRAFALIDRIKESQREA